MQRYGLFRRLALLAIFGRAEVLRANPVGGTVSQGTASITTAGSQLTIQTSDRAFINWQSFNIGAGEATRFIQPSTSSLVWNRINDSNPSQILGSLSANGYVVLQNSAGFFIGGEASLTTHGLMLTTAPMPPPDLAGGGAWVFNALPPTAKILNYGQITVGNGGSAYLIANQVENHGTITAPQGTVGLLAGSEVLVSERADGRGLSARVTLPEGAVDNQGRIVAGGGLIAMHAKVVNQNGLLQANSARNVNGVIELVAGDALKLGKDSAIVAKGDSTGTSPGGFVVARSTGTFQDVKGSTIEVAGGAEAGSAGIVQVFGSGASAAKVQSKFNGQSAAEYSGLLALNPRDVTLSLSPTSISSARANYNLVDLAAYAQIDLHAVNDITLAAPVVLRDPGGFGAFSLNAGNNVVLKDGTSIRTQKNWDINVVAGLNPNAPVETINGQTRQAGVYLDGNAALQTADGQLAVYAEREVIVNPGPEYDLGTGSAGNNGIRTTQGGSVLVAARTGDVNTGGNFAGYTFGLSDAPYYKAGNNVGGVSTIAGGDVTILAGGDVSSFNPQQSGPGDLNKAAQDGGSGAFGAGDVNVTAGGSIRGHFLLANGVGRINAGGDIGATLLQAQSQGFSLSLIKGSWSVSAPNGNIYLQDVRNPNGIFNDRSVLNYPGYHAFDYDFAASVALNARGSVEVTGGGVPHAAPSANATPIPLIFPPKLSVVAGANVQLDKSVVLFPSPVADINITSGGDLVGKPDLQGLYPSLQMSDSNSKQWLGPDSFTSKEHGTTPLQYDDPTPVKLTVGGSVKTINVFATKPARVQVAGDLVNSSFVGQNFKADDVTSIKVAGAIRNTPAFVFQNLDQPIVSADPTDPRGWDSIFSLLVNPTLIASIQVAPNTSANVLREDVTRARLFEGNPGFFYNPTTLRFGFRNPMPDNVRSILEGPLTVLRYGPDGLPLVENGHFVTAQATFVPRGVISALYQASQSIPQESPLGYQIGGPGKFQINADSMDLGSTLGVISWGIGGPPGDDRRYAALSRLIDSGASVDITLKNNLEMFTSTIASLYGGDVNVVSTAGELNLGTQDLFGQSRFAFGIYTSGPSDVHVTAAKDINIAGSRIAAYDGGNVSVKSLGGNVNAGSGGNTYVNVQLVSRDEKGEAVTREDPIYGSGIVAVSLPANLRGPNDHALPGDISVETPRGDILSSKAGILQIALDGNVAGGPKVTLRAGSPATATEAAVPGNIDLGESGLIGGSVDVSAQGNIRGLIVSRQSTSVNAAQNFNGTVLAAGSASLSAGGSVSGSVIGIGGVSASAGGVNSASLLGQNVSVNGGAAQSTLGTSATATTTSQAAVQNSTAQAKEQAAAKSTLDDDDKKKGLKKRPALVRRSRVTVVLPN